MQSLKRGTTLSRATDPATETKPAFKACMDECPLPTLADAYEISTR